MHFHSLAYSIDCTESSGGNKTQPPRRERRHRYATPPATSNHGAGGGEAEAGEGARGEAEDGRVHPDPTGGAQPRYDGTQEAQGAQRRGGRSQGHRPGDRRGPPLHRGR